MKFFDKLQEATVSERQYLMTSPIIQNCLDDGLSLEDYVAFLQQAFHHVKHTVPLLMATGARFSEQQEWLREAIAEYISEELGHQEWILNDIEVCGFDKEKALRSRPNFSTELMVSYAYDTVNRVNPIGFFGMVNVLEGTSIKVADAAVTKLKEVLGLPLSAFSYLKSHGALDQEHMKFFEGLMNKIKKAEDQEQIIHSAKAFYVLYANVFRELSPSQAKAIAA